MGMAGSGQGIRAAAAGFLVAVVVLAAAPASALALTPAADEGMWQTDGKVYAMTQVGNTLFIGGKFTQVMSADRTTVQPAENIAAIDVTTGAPVPGWAAGITRTAGGAEVHAAASAVATTLYGAVGSTASSCWPAISLPWRRTRARSRRFRAACSTGAVHARTSARR